MDDHAPTLVDAIRGALGFEQLSLELIDRVARDRATVREIADAARFWAESSTLPPVPDGTLRPFMEARHWADRGPAGLNVLNGTAQLWSELYNPDAVPRAVDAVKCHLLYCHSIALTTPLDPRYAPDDHNRSSRQFVAGLQVLAELAPLIDARIVHFAPHLRHGSDDFYPLVREAFAHVTQGAPLTKATDPFGPLPAADMKAIREDVAAQRYPSEWSDFASAEEALKDWIRRTRENRLFSVLRGRRLATVRRCATAARRSVPPIQAQPHSSRLDR